MKKKVIEHLKGDIKNFKKEAAEDRELISELKGKKMAKKKESKKHEKRESKKHEMEEREVHGRDRSDKKFERVLREFKEGRLKAGAKKKSPKVKKVKQAVAIAYSESRRAYKNKKKK